MSNFNTSLAKLEFETIRQRVVRYASSEPGREVLQQLQVSTSARDIRQELARVSELKRLLEEEEAFPLEGVHNVRGAIQRAAIEGSVLLSKELAQVASTARASRVLRTFLSKRRERFPLLWEMAELLHVDKVLEFNIDQAIDDTGAVRAGASRELQSIRRSIADRYDLLKKKLEGILRNVSDLGFSQEEIITTREGRMVIPVKAEHKNRVPGFMHSASSSGATVFIEPTETLELNNEIRSLQFQEQREIERILRALTTQVGEAKEPLIRSLDILAVLDALHARAKYSIEILGVAPEVNPEGPIRLIQARHPILLLNHGFSGTVPLDLDLGVEYSTLLISGPNAGGKSVAMKCVGLLVLMVQAGLHIPASDKSVLRVFKQMFVDIGDEQSIESDLSTFSSHLVNLQEIDRLAGAESLVLIDEIGSGTDPGEGGAIAAALLESLTCRGASTIATTHQGSLKVFAHETKGIENGAMEFDQGTLTPTYRFRSGIPGSSYALEMAARLGFPDEFMKRARGLLGHRQTQLENLLTELESSAQQYRHDLEEVRAEKGRLDELVGRYEANVSSLSAEVKELKRKALEEAERIVDRANSVIERSVREIREKAADRDSVRAIRREVSQLKEEISALQEVAAPAPEEAETGSIRVGSPVKLAGGGDTGEVESVSADGRTAVVLFGNVKMRVASSDLRPAKERPVQHHSAPVFEPEKPGTVEQDLDLRGLTGEEAIPMVDKFIDNAVLAGLHRIDIIHGKGTGALRKKVTEFLSGHPRVQSFRLGEWNEGGTGATIVELKDIS